MKTDDIRGLIDSLGLEHVETVPLNDTALGVCRVRSQFGWEFTAMDGMSEVDVKMALMRNYVSLRDHIDNIIKRI